METYQQMKKRKQSEFTAFPWFFALSEHDEERFADGMKKLGVTSATELCKSDGGMFYRKTDAKKLHEMTERYRKEFLEAYRDQDFLYRAIRKEMADHEYHITESDEEVLTALNLREEDLKTNPDIRCTWEKAREDFLADIISRRVPRRFSSR